MVLGPKVGITGSSGLLGGHVASYFLRKKYKVLASSKKRPKIKHKNFFWKKLDLSKKILHEKLDRAYKDINCLIHIGAYVPKSQSTVKKNILNKINVDASLSLAKWSKKNNIHFIYISGSIIYKLEKKNSEDDLILKNSENIYINSKIQCEKKIIRLFKKNKKCLTILRPSSIYGTGMDKSKLIPKLINLIKKNKNIVIFNNQKTNVNFIHAKDVASAVFLSFKMKKTGIFNIGSVSCNDFFSLAKILVKILKSKSKISLKIKKNVKLLKSLDVKINKAKATLRWSPSVTMSKGLKMTVRNRWI